MAVKLKTLTKDVQTVTVEYRTTNGKKYLRTFEGFIHLWEDEILVDAGYRVVTATDLFKKSITRWEEVETDCETWLKTDHIVSGKIIKVEKNEKKLLEVFTSFLFLGKFTYKVVE